MLMETHCVLCEDGINIFLQYRQMKKGEM